MFVKFRFDWLCFCFGRRFFGNSIKSGSGGSYKVRHIPYLCAQKTISLSIFFLFFSFFFLLRSYFNRLFENTDVLWLSPTSQAKEGEEARSSFYFLFKYVLGFLNSYWHRFILQNFGVFKTVVLKSEIIFIVNFYIFFIFFFHVLLKYLLFFI